MLLIGKCFTKSNPTIVGGAIVLFEQLLKDFNQFNRKYKLIDLNKRNYLNPITAYFTIISTAIVKIPRHSVIFFNGSNPDYFLFAPIIVSMSKAFRKKVILRKFGGNFHEYYENMSPIKKPFVKYALTHADILFFETKYLVDYFKKINSSTYWFPNVRQRTINIEIRPGFSKKYIFISHVREEKGINELLQVIKQLPKDYTVHIYGLIVNYNCPKELQSTFDKSYKGAVNSDMVMKTLNKYDVLLLPSYFEGYPGIIIESFSIGMPVISTKLQGIQEMVDEGENGFLISPKNTVELKESILRFNKGLYKTMSSNAFKAFDKFDSGKQMNRVMKIIDGKSKAN